MISTLPNKIDLGEQFLKTLKKSRLAALFRDLPTEDGLGLAKAARSSVTEKAAHRPGMLDAALPQVLDYLGRRGPRKLLVPWYESRISAFFEEIGERGMDDWRSLLVCRLYSAVVGEPAPPRDLIEAADAVISGTLESAPSSIGERWRKWMILREGQWTRVKLETALGNLVESAREAIGRLTTDGELDLAPLEQWTAVARCLEEVSRAREAFERRGEEVLPTLRRAAELLGLEGPGGGVGGVWALLDPEWLAAFDGGMVIEVPKLDAPSWVARALALADIVARLNPPPAGRDLTELEDEASALRRAVESRSEVDPVLVAPALSALGRLLLDGAALSEEERGRVGGLTYNYCSRVLAGGVELEGPAGDEPARKPGAAVGKFGEEGPGQLADGEHPATGEGASAADDERADEQLCACSDDAPDTVSADSIPVDGEYRTDPATRPAEGSAVSRPPDTPDENLGREGAECVLPDQYGVEKTEPPDQGEDEGEESSSPPRSGDQREPPSIADPGSDAEVPAATFPGDIGSGEVARLLLGRSSVTAAETSALQARLLVERRLDYSYWLSRACEGAGALPVWLAETIELGVQYQPGFRQSEERLRELFGSALGQLELSATLCRGECMLLAASCVRPGLLAPQTHPVYVLRALRDRLLFLPRFDELAEGLASFAERGVPLTSELLEGVSADGSWEEAKRRLEKETRQWLKKAPQRRIRYEAATRVWSHWLGKDGELAALLARAQAGTRGSDEIRTALDQWRDDDWFHAQMNRTDREINNRPNWKPIQFGARESLRRLVLEAVELAGRWASLWQRAPTNDSGLLTLGRRQLAELRPMAEAVVASIESWTAPSADSFLWAGALRLREALREVIGGGEATTRRNVDPLADRTKGLLLVPEAGRNGDLTGSTNGLLKGLLRHLSQPLTWERAFSRHLQAGRIDQALAVVECYAEAAEPTVLQGLHAQTNEARRLWVRQAEANAESLKEEVSSALLTGGICDGDESGFLADIAAAERRLNERPDEPDIVEEQLAATRASLDKAVDKRTQGVEAERVRIRRLYLERGRDFPPEISVNLDRAMGAQEISVAEEVLARAERALEYEEWDWADEPATREVPRTFEDMAKLVDAIYEACADLQVLRRKITKGDLHEFPRLTALDEEQRRQLGDVLRGWATLAGLNSRQKPDEVRNETLQVLRWLGFHIDEGVRIDAVKKPAPPHFWTHYRVPATIESPLPLFGSLAHGRHEVLVAWNKLEPEQIVQWIAANVAKDRPVTMLCPQRLRTSARRRLAHAARKSGVCPLVIDTCLLVWLCGFNALDRPTALLEAGLAGGAHNPYTPEIAGGVPAEMFFGRKRDVDNLWRLDGPCIVFGGRQMGKSALLQEVARRYHAPALDQFVLYAGAKHTNDLWSLLRRALAEGGLLKEKGLGTPERVKGAIKDMLEQARSRRVLVLLDECDHLLDSDARDGFRQLHLLRDLMTETGRRFKVVLTGLHNVQRFQRIPNQPLAHFGNPLCIGPLPPRDASALVQLPIAGLGYQFGPVTLVQRVLAHTSYHPGLIQLFCHELVDTLLRTSKHNVDMTPPFIIDEKVIAEVYGRVGLGKKMRERFDWTLDLDKRYRAIGYMVAWMELNLDPAVSSSGAIGFRVSDIFKEIKAVWPEGFRDVGIDEVEALLGEMVGLGVLLDRPGHRFRLRSPNILRLLGGKNGVADELERLEAEPYESPTNPFVMRRVLSSTETQIKATSPFSMSQEADLLARTRGVDLVLGSEALGIEGVPAALLDLFRAADEKAEVEVVPQGLLGDGDELAASIRERYLAKASSEGLRFIIDGTQALPKGLGRFVEQLGAWMGGLRTENRFVRLVVTIPPPVVLSWRESGVLDRFSETEGISVHRLRRWQSSGLRHWFHDVERIPTPGQPEKWMTQTGGWPRLVRILQGAKLALEGSGCEDRLAEARGGLLSAAGIDVDPVVWAVFDMLSQVGGESEVADLAILADGEIPAGRVGAAAQYLLDLGLVDGSAERVRAEPLVLGEFTEASKIVVAP